MAMTLEPCPFCGCTDHETSPWRTGRKHEWWQCNCGNPDCGAEVGAPTPEGAVARWNRRAHLTQSAQAVGAWMTEDGRVISARQKAKAINDGGASASSVAPYSIQLTRALSPAQAVDVDFTISDEAPRILTWHGDNGCRPATDEETVLWDKLRALAGEKAGWRVPEVTFDMVRVAEHFCPTDLPHLDKLRWKARKLSELLAAPTPPTDGEE